MRFSIIFLLFLKSLLNALQAYGSRALIRMGLEKGRTYHLFKRERGLNDLNCLYLTGGYRVSPHLFLSFGLDNLFDDPLVTTGKRPSKASNRYVYYGMPCMAKAALGCRF